jgi:hypothetical protein
MMLLKPISLVLTILCATAAPAFAWCPAVPDGPDSQQVQNAQQRDLCLQQELHDSTNDRNAQTQFDTLKSTVQQMEIQRRFDQLPSPGPTVPRFPTN